MEEEGYGRKHNKSKRNGELSEGRKERLETNRYVIPFRVYSTIRKDF